MTLDKPTRMKIGYNIKRVIAGLLIVIGTIWLTNGIWQPRYDGWRCGRIAAELSKQYGLVVRYGDPSEFYVPPQPVIPYKTYDMDIERAEIKSAFIALKGVQEALTKYPPALIKKYLSAIFISGIIRNYGAQGAGTYANSWIYVSALAQFDLLGQDYYSETLHHELSSFFLKRAGFNSQLWREQNPPDFNYLRKFSDVLLSSAAENRRPLEEAPLWYEAGFVHDYGMASIENDFNTYAELAMAHPKRLKVLAQQYPRISAKTKIFVKFYSSLASELGTYFKSVGLMDESADK